MTINDLKWLFLDGFTQIKVYNLKTNDYIYEGRIDDIDYDIEYLEIQSLDDLETNVLTINVEVESDEK